MTVQLVPGPVHSALEAESGLFAGEVSLNIQLSHPSFLPKEKGSCKNVSSIERIDFNRVNVLPKFSI